MDAHEVNSDRPPGPSRRELLKAAAALPLLAGNRARADEPRRKANADGPWWLREQPRKSRVVELQSDRVVRGEFIDQTMLREMTEKVVAVYADTPDSARGWKRILGGANRIAIKFNQVGASILRTTPAMATALVESLAAAGYAKERITLVEAPPHIQKHLGTRSATVGWDQSIEIDGEPERLARWWVEADAVINVGFLKTHRIAGMSAAMKNISHGIIERPARYHASACAPYIAQVIGSKLVTEKLRLNLINATKAAIKGGPGVTSDNIEDLGLLLAGGDPVALDAVAFELLLAQRRRAGVDGPLEAQYIEEAGRRGVGRAQPAGIEHIVL